MAAWFLAAMLLVAPGGGWSNLKRVTRDRLYGVVLRERGVSVTPFIRWASRPYSWTPRPDSAS